MKRIKLTQGQSTIIDDADFEWLNQWKWYAHQGKGTFYAARWYNIRMHREIMSLIKGDGKQVDHKNSDGLNNRRENLRVCTNSENSQNRRKRLGASCEYLGVFRKIGRRGWRAQIRQNQRKIYLGSYKKKEDAARAYDRKALELYGPDAKTNFPTTPPKGE